VTLDGSRSQDASTGTRLHRQGSAFRSRHPRAVPDPALAHLRYRLSAAFRDVLDLARQVEVWKARSDVAVTVAQDPSNPSAFEHRLVANSAFPYEEWELLAARSIHECRSVLDSLNMLMLEQFAEEDFDEDRVYFPITANGKDWRSWRQQHRALPSWVVERYRSVQPNQGPYRGLTGLSRLDNDRKHKRSTPMKVAVTGLISKGNFTVEGLVDDESLNPQIEAFSNTLSPGVRSVRLARITYTPKVIAYASDPTAQVEVDIIFSFGSESYHLAEIVELPRRIGHVVDFVARGNPEALGRYQSRPSYIAKGSAVADTPALEPREA